MKNYLLVRYEGFINFAEFLKKEKNNVYFLTNFYTDYIYFNKVTKIINLKKNKSKKETINLNDQLKKMEIRDVEKLNFKKNQNTLEKIYLSIEDIMKKKKIDYVLIHNGYYWLDQFVINIAQKLGVKIIYFEEGFFRPNTISMDNIGINYKSSIKTQWEYWKENLEFSKNQELNLKENFVKKNQKDVLIKIIKTFEDKLFYYYPKTYLHNSFKQYFFKTLAKYRRKNEEKIPQNYIFAPFQVHDDSQILFHSSKLKSMNEFSHAIIKAVEIINNNRSEKINIVFKEHPQDIGRISYKKLKENYKNKANIFFLKDIPAENLIKNSKLVITINSTIGIESLWHLKNVITLGEAFYNIEGLVIENKNIEELHLDIKKALEINMDKKLKKMFIYFLKYHYNICGSFFEKNELVFKKIKLRIEEEKII